MSRKNWYSPCLRYPRTTQEIRENCYFNDPYIRGRRRDLPTAWDDFFVHKQKSWKNLRTTQYRHKDELTKQYRWHSYPYTYGDYVARMAVRNIADKAAQNGCYYKWKWGCLNWYGPSFGYEGFEVGDLKND